ncbi:MAG: hypothetical protein EOO24_29125 [Comamonadaceae bacterium]|nr:MAG: hypothetical protein EOO24_29125 [Comamonadaceae bacterium]
MTSEPAMQPLEELRQFLAAPRYARSLVLRMEDGTLVVTKGPASSNAGGELRIRCDGGTRQVTFTLATTPGDPAPWTRVCDADEARRVLERVLHKRLDWFHEG